MRREIIFNLIAATSLTGVLKAEGPYETYIETYAPVAVAQQEEYGIPASITLAQGILESGAGQSTLATEGNNHFGIKCHNEWDGKTMLRSDDAPDECFRVYDSPEESYRDHSLFLKRSRYAPLFELEVTDYGNWAKGLKKCGYATDPNYATRLITIIERYNLYKYDTEAGRIIDENVAFIHETLARTHPLRKSRGLRYVVATPGDTYESIAAEFGMKPGKLKELNDAEKRNEIKAWEEVYLEPKLDYPPEGLTKVTIGEGESMHSIAQRYGMKLDVIKSLNKKVKDEPGTVLIIARNSKNH